MKEAYKVAKVLENKEISKGIWQMKVDISLGSKPGQFFMLRFDNDDNSPLLSRPLGVCDEDENGLTMLYQLVGKATKLMSKLKIDDKVKILGPLGNGFDLVENKKIAIVAGGIGIAPLLYLCKNLKNKPDFYAGFSEEEYFIENFRPYVDKIITTVDKIDKKFITEEIDPSSYDIIYACGPNPMLKSLCEKNKDTKIQISMEARMACGIGACLGCTIESKDGEFLRVCKDGPVFDSRKVF